MRFLAGSIVIGVMVLVQGCASGPRWIKTGADENAAEEALDDCRRLAVRAVPYTGLAEPYRDAYGRTVTDRISVSGHDAYPYDVVSPMMTARAANAGTAAAASARWGFVEQCMTEAGWEPAR